MKSEDVERVRLSLPSYYHDESCECGSCESTREDHAAFERLVAENAQLKAQNERLISRGFQDLHHENAQLKARIERVRDRLGDDLLVMLSRCIRDFSTERTSRYLPEVVAEQVRELLGAEEVECLPGCRRRERWIDEPYGPTEFYVDHEPECPKNSSTERE